MPSYKNSTTTIPSVFFSVTFAFNKPSPKLIIVSTWILLKGLDKHSHLLPPKSFNSNNSIWALVLSFSPINLAGITLVSFKTKTSPFFK